jgi:hypothetical protein
MTNPTEGVWLESTQFHKARDLTCDLLVLGIGTEGADCINERIFNAALRRGVWVILKRSSFQGIVCMLSDFVYAQSLSDILRFLEVHG